MSTPITAEEQKQIVKLRAAGLTLRQIGGKLNRDPKTVGRVLKYPAKYKKSSTNTPAVDTKAAKNGQQSSAKKHSSKSSSATAKPANIRKNYSKSQATNSKQLAPSLFAEYNSVNVEHRCVIKFLTKLGESASNIYSQLRKVYTPANPELAAIQYWVKQFKHGRQTILNAPKIVQKISLAKKVAMKKSNSPSKPRPSSSTPTKKPTKKSVVKLPAKTKKKSDSNGNTEAGEENAKKVETGNNVTKKRSGEGSPSLLFTIKLPGMDRFNKTLH